MRLRLGGPDDAEALAAILAEGFEGYRSFAPPGWEPPHVVAETERMRQRLADPDTWCLLAEVDGEVAGHIGILPGEASRAPTGDPGVAHLWQLFVRPAHQGTGVATALLHRGLAETAARGFTRIRLFTPALQARARRFYEREGFIAPAPPADDQALGLAVVEYWRDLP